MGRKPVGIVRFLGTNCDRDVWQAVENSGAQAEWLWYQDQFSEDNYESLILPGGFSYGDYLRCGALSAKAPVMHSVVRAAKKGVPILGICNGFQILCESGLLPGVLIRNESLRFVDKWVGLKQENACQAWGDLGEGGRCRLPVAHGEGRFYVEEEEKKQLYDRDQVWWKYDENPNGSVDDIAGVMNKEKNVAGLMPHPERAIYEWMGDTSGRTFFGG